MQNPTIAQKQQSVISNPFRKSQFPEWLKEEISDMRKQEARELQSEYGDAHNEETNDWVSRGGY